MALAGLLGEKGQVLVWKVLEGGAGWGLQGL